MTTSEIIMWVLIDALLIVFLFFFIRQGRKADKSNLTIREFYEGTGFNITKKHGTLCCDDETKTWSVAYTKKKPQFYKYSDVKDYKMFSNTVNPEISGAMLEDAPPVITQSFSSRFTSKMAYGDFSSYITVYLHDGREVNIPLIATANSRDRKEINQAEVRLSKGTFELLKYIKENA